VARHRPVGGSANAKKFLRLGPRAQITASMNAVAQTTIAATDAESNARSFLGLIRDVSHQPSYVRMLTMMSIPENTLGQSIGARCDRDHTTRGG
jgi:hypothetical protein